jgi:AcrR family transcriptional regulator
VSADPSLIPSNQARKRIHAAAMKLFADRGVTRVNISELATAVGMARGTVYSHVPDIERLFEDVAGQLAREMTERVVAGFVGVSDPAQRLACGVRQYIRRAHEEPLWGRFMTRVGLGPEVTQAVMSSQALTDIEAGVASGRYRIAEAQIPAMVALLTGSTLAAMLPVLEGHATWREIGSDTAELLLIALGISRDEARAIVTTELHPLPPLA